jgi:hypothetical protein
MENYSKIKPDDIVIFGWTELTRMLVPFEIDKDKYIWRSTIFPNNFLSQKTNDEIAVMLNVEIYREKQMETIKFIEKILPNNITINWTWSTIPHEHSLTITKETNGLLNDFHYGEEGHRFLFNKIKEQLGVTKRVRINLWDQFNINK